MVKSIHKIEESHKKMSSLGKKLRVLFIVLFSLVCVGALVVLIVSLLALFAHESPAISAFEVFSIVSALLNFVIYGAILLILSGLSRDMALGLSPFTSKHARQIKIIGCIFILDLFVSFIISPGFATIANIGGFDVGVVSSVAGEYPTLPLNIGSIIGIVVCFSLSAVWKYGELLQTESDDLY